LLKLIACIAKDHDGRALLLAVTICLLSTLTAFALVRQAQEQTSKRTRWIVLIGYVTGVGVWATHFIAMLAYRPNLPTTYSSVGTTDSVAVSITLAIAGWWVGFSDRRNARLWAAAILTAGIAAMHAVGMAAVQTTGHYRYDPVIIVTALLTGGLCVAMATNIRGDRLPRFPLVQALLLTMGICTIHFGSMVAVTIQPDASAHAPVESISRQVLSGGVTAAVVILLIVAIFVVVLDIRVRNTVARVSQMMSHDALTGLLNTSGFETAATAMLGENTNAKFALIRLDLDRFREINATYGHATGDVALTEVANRLRSCCRGALVGRFMGDGFNILLPETAAHPFEAWVRTIAECLARPFDLGAGPIRIGAHIAASRYPAHAKHLEGLRRTAGVALYRAQRSAGFRLLEYSPAMEEEAAAPHELISPLRNALQAKEFSLVFQPISCVATGGTVGFEALLRWQHPERGNVPPAEFVPVAEAAGLMIEIGDWALNEACRQAAQWRHQLKVAVNLSAVQLADRGIVDTVRGALAASSLPASRLELEITEGMLIEDTDKTVQILSEIKAMGVRISMDDFGTGFSSLSYFRRFPFDKVKIDQSFVKDMVSNRQSMAIVSAVISLGRVLGMVVLAEGVETAEQLEVLSAEGCHQVQGYLIGRPALPADLQVLTEQANSPSHFCSFRCDDCLERLRPPAALTRTSARELHITRFNPADIAA
jgi:diguanylate cyclase (GGDEF)-like protein